MAKIETRQLPHDGKFNSVSDIIRALQGALADELSAANLYMEILQYLSKSNTPAELTLRLNEILLDERNHAGSLLHCVELMDGSIAEAMAKGAEGG